MQPIRPKDAKQHFLAFLEKVKQQDAELSKKRPKISEIPKQELEEAVDPDRPRLTADDPDTDADFIVLPPTPQALPEVDPVNQKVDQNTEEDDDWLSEGAFDAPKEPRRDDPTKESAKAFPPPFPQAPSLAPIFRPPMESQDFVDDFGTAGDFIEPPASCVSCYFDVALIILRTKLCLLCTSR